MIKILFVIYNSKSGAKSSAIIVFVVVGAPCALAGEPILEVRTGSGIAESKEQCGSRWHME